MGRDCWVPSPVGCAEPPSELGQQSPALSSPAGAMVPLGPKCFFAVLQESQGRLGLGSRHSGSTSSADHSVGNPSARP